LKLQHDHLQKKHQIQTKEITKLELDNHKMRKELSWMVKRDHEILKRLDLDDLDLHSD